MNKYFSSRLIAKQAGIALLELAMLLVILLPLGLATFAVIDVLVMEARLDSLMQRELREIKFRALRFEVGGQAFWGTQNKKYVTEVLSDQGRSKSRKKRIFEKLGLSQQTIRESTFDLAFVGFNIRPSSGANLDKTLNGVLKAVAHDGPKAIEANDVMSLTLKNYIETHLGDPQDVLKDRRYPLAIPTALNGVLYQAEYGAINLLGGPMRDDGFDSKKIVTNEDARADYMPSTGTVFCSAVIPYKNQLAGKILKYIVENEDDLRIVNVRSMTGRTDF